ncbi:hypothetical protein NLU13_3579 [Sarocladium strictum]|uniref:Uncharacterized protein n=1 Tax=Sarocladium strictum TaxID=5046 RepID=A0AA39GML2_SARSR|nr:hypothetical protein NLU13_3579 [Sarocladium strictum]
MPDYEPVYTPQHPKAPCFHHDNAPPLSSPTPLLPHHRRLPTPTTTIVHVHGPSSPPQPDSQGRHPALSSTVPPHAPRPFPYSLASGAGSAGPRADRLSDAHRQGIGTAASGRGGSGVRREVIGFDVERRTEEGGAGSKRGGEIHRQADRLALYLCEFCAGGFCGHSSISLISSSWASRSAGT